MAKSEVNNDPYSAVARGKLQLKGDNSVKKKQKKKSKKKSLEQIRKLIESSEPVQTEPAAAMTKTKAELAYLTQREKMVSLNLNSLTFLTKFDSSKPKKFWKKHQ